MDNFLKNYIAFGLSVQKLFKDISIKKITITENWGNFIIII